MATPPERGTRETGFAVRRDGEAVPGRLRGAIVAIGNFDGVHRGHQALIADAEAVAREGGGPTVVLTFEPHPRTFFTPDKPVFRLTPEPVKLAILKRLGLDGVFVRRFDRPLASTSAADFVEKLLVGELGASGVVVGQDFHFGKGREGTPAVLADLCRRHGLTCRILAVVTESGEAVSSSAARQALERGEIGKANSLLGYRWLVQGEVRHGEKRGRTFGFPTANIRLPDDCRLGYGIYAVRAALPSGDIRNAVASFGRRPTFDDGAPLLEVFLFDFSGDLYGQTLQVEFVAWIRGEERFPSAEALVVRMHEDAKQARQALASSDHAPSMIS
jgi:riboflavin kinase / FMN adenylyltransferase